MIPLALLALLSATPAAPAPKTVVSPAWSTVEVKPELAAFYADHVAGVLRADGFKVITSAEFSALLDSQRQAELMGCSEASQSCMAELAAALGADFTVLASVAKLEDTFRVHLKLLRGGTTEVVSETEVEASGEKKLLDALTGAAHRLTESLRGPAVPGPSAASAHVSVRGLSWIPFVASGALIVAAALSWGVSVSDHDQLVSNLKTPSDAHLVANTELASEGKSAQLAAQVMISLAGAAALAGIAMVVFGAPAEPASPTVSLVPAGSGFALDVRFP